MLVIAQYEIVDTFTIGTVYHFFERTATAEAKKITAPCGSPNQYRMQILLSLLVAFSVVQLATAQHRLGLDDNPSLTEQEGQFLDSLLRGQRGRLEFSTKRVAFLYGGSTGNALQAKSAFFHQNVLPWTTTGRTPVLRLVKLTETEKKASGGYDALVVAWAKVFTARQKEKMLQRLAYQENSLGN